jgi:hypothetical protein
MWLVINVLSSFLAGLLSFKTTFSKRVWINICTPIVLTVLFIVLPGLVSPDKKELLWRLISIPAALFCGIIAAFLSEIPIAIFSKRHRRADESGKKT